MTQVPHEPFWLPEGCQVTSEPCSSSTTWVRTVDQQLLPHSKGMWVLRCSSKQQARDGQGRLGQSQCRPGSGRDEEDAASAVTKTGHANSRAQHSHTSLAASQVRQPGHLVGTFTHQHACKQCPEYVCHDLLLLVMLCRTLAPLARTTLRGSLPLTLDGERACRAPLAFAAGGTSVNSSQPYLKWQQSTLRLAHVKVGLPKVGCRANSKHIRP